MKGNFLLKLIILGLCSGVQLHCILPIGWPIVKATCSTIATDIKESSAIVLCPAGCQNKGGPICGTDTYSDDSPVCRAAIHAEVITDEGGNAPMQKAPGQQHYSGTTRNGITTDSWGLWPGSFIFNC